MMGVWRPVTRTHMGPERPKLNPSTMTTHKANRQHEKNDRRLKIIYYNKYF